MANSEKLRLEQRQRQVIMSFYFVVFPLLASQGVHWIDMF